MAGEIRREMAGASFSGRKIAAAGGQEGQTVVSGAIPRQWRGYRERHFGIPQHRHIIARFRGRAEIPENLKR